MTGVKYDEDLVDRYTYEYGANGKVAEVYDNEEFRIARTDYDLAERPCQTELFMEAASGRHLLYRTRLQYDKLNNLQKFCEEIGNPTPLSGIQNIVETHQSEYAYDRDNRITQITYNGGAHKVGYTYDNLGRVITRVAENGSDAGKVTSSYGYVGGGYGAKSTTPLVASIDQKGISFAYTYDSRGNITSEIRTDASGNSLTTTYAYDALGQLVRVNDPHDTTASAFGTTWVFSYDRGGNITGKACHPFSTGALEAALETIPYTYGDSNWKDKLTACNGHTFTYDAIGNPLSDGVWNYQWEAGRRLKAMNSEGTALTFKYDHNGLRTQKVVQQDWYPVTTNYTLHGKLIAHMTVDYTDWDEVDQKDVLHFFYDAQSRPAKVRFNGEIYTYVHNLQGDIVGLIDSDGELVVEYKYDACGKLLSTTGTLADTLGKRNPFRYRGYVYDEESGLYYLRSRYYNPEWSRFINADGYIGKVSILGQHNQFSYCANVPVGLCDETGQSFLSGLKRFGEQLVYNFLYSSQIKFWNAVCLGLYSIGCKYSAELLSHSLQPKPTTVSYSNSSSLAEKIKNDSEFKVAMADIIKNQTFNVETSMSFNSDFDLFGALHSVNMIVSPVTINGVDMYHVNMTDKYDFKYEKDYSSQSPSFWKRAMKAGAIAGNNLAYLDMNRGAINEYRIVIDFYVD